MRKLVLVLAIILSLGSVYAQEIGFTGVFSTIFGTTAPNTENPGNLDVGRIIFSPSLETYCWDSTLFIEGTITYDSISNVAAFSLGEAYLDYSSSFWGIRLGRQKIVWGQADGINLTNSVFPENSSDLFTDDGELPVEAVCLSLYGNSFSVDGYLIPLFRASSLPLEESNPLRKILIPQSVPMVISGSLVNVPVSVGTLSTPEMNLENMEFGLKASCYLPFCDMSLYGFYGWDKKPLLSYTMNTGITVNGTYKRVLMLGADAAKPIGPTVLRLEAAIFPNRYVQACDRLAMAGQAYVQQSQFTALVGVDWMPNGWTLTAQYYADVLMNKSEDTERENAYEHEATFSASKTILDDTLELSISGMVNLGDFDSAVTLKGSYSLSDQIKFSAGANLFLPGPEEDGTFGKLKDLSTVYVVGQYQF